MLSIISSVLVGIERAFVYGRSVMLAGLDVRDSDVLALARQLRQAGFVETAEKLESAYDREARLIGLTLGERDEILRALEDAPVRLALLRGQLLRDRERWVREGLA
jgi:hypothetical protein